MNSDYIFTFKTKDNVNHIKRIIENDQIRIVSVDNIIVSYISYYNNGLICQRYHYNHIGQLHGQQIIYDNTGRVLSDIRYVNGQPLKSDWPTHKSHCCITHGCKYGDDDCPVETGLIKQQYKCLGGC